MKRLSVLKTIVLFVAVIAFAASCSKSGSNPTPANTSKATATITSLSATAGPYNTSVIITGTGFSSTAANDRVFFNGKSATITAATATQITATVPLGAGTGTVTVSVSGDVAAAGPVFTYQLSAIVSTLAGNAGATGTADGLASAATFKYLWGVAVDPAGNIYVSDFDAHNIRKITAVGLVSAFAGSGSFGLSDGKGNMATFFGPTGLITDAGGNLYVSDAVEIRKITSDGTVSTLFRAGNDITDLAIDKQGNLFATDEGANLILKISSAGVATTFAGSGTEGAADGKGTQASFAEPVSLTFDAAGNMFVMDEGSNKVRKITTDGTVTTIAGNGTKGLTNGKALSASFNDPTGIVVDGSGNIYIGDFDNNVIRKISADGTVSTFAGTGVAGATDGPGATATFDHPQGLAFDAAGNLYVACGPTIRKIVMQ